MSIADSFIRRQILTQRYIRTLQKENKRELFALLERVSSLLERQPNSMRLQLAKADIEAVIAKGFEPIKAKMAGDALEFALQENDFTHKVIVANSKVLLRAPQASSVEYALKTSVMDVGTKDFNLTLGSAVEQFAESQATAIRKTIADGILFGQSVPEISAAVRQLATSRSAAQVEAITRTTINFAGSQTRKNFVAEHAEYFDGEEYVAVLDQRTTPLCAGLDGQVFPVGEGTYPPTHWNCRSVRVPVMKRNFSKSSKRTDRRNFDEWLRGQSNEFQDEYFAQFSDGKKRAKLFRDGGLEMQQYRDSKGRNYSLQELKTLYPLAFEKAGI